MSFFSLYNLFDAVEYSHNDSQSQIQKLFLHLKKQENEIDLLKRQVNKFEGLQFLTEESTLKKLKSVIDADKANPLGGRPSAISAVSALSGISDTKNEQMKGPGIDPSLYVEAD
mmetsp:Transcript_31826/g.48818  ORF Transcript_31826/g.48818 Transcript_31826/m.48818 type:complete len:114 (+) Transcript_31826:2254-2595(+)